MVLLEMVYCRITGRTRNLPKVHHFIPLLPFDSKTKKRVRRESEVNEEDHEENESPDQNQIKVLLDMSNEGHLFKMLESLLEGIGPENEFLTILLNSGIPGLEYLNKGHGETFKFEKMSDENKKRFCEAVTGSEGKISSKAAAALIAAAASGGDPEIANSIVKKMMMGEMRQDEYIDSALLTALLAATALVSQGASNEKILEIMQRELGNSGLRPEEILAKTMILQKAMAGDNSSGFINHTLRNALSISNINANELREALIFEKMMVLSDVSPEEIAKCMLIQTILEKSEFSSSLIEEALKDLIPNEVLRESSYSLEEISVSEIAMGVKLTKALQGGKIRGMKEIKSLLESARDEKSLRNALSLIISEGHLDPKAVSLTFSLLSKCSFNEKSFSQLAKVLLLQKELFDTVMPVHDIANAMTICLTLDTKDVSKSFDELKSMTYNNNNNKKSNLSPSSLCLSLITALSSSNSIPLEGLRLMKRAMKTRRGSVENVAETLIEALASTGETPELIARAMIQALTATGESPEVIAITLKRALENGGLEFKDILHIMAKGLANSGVSSEDIAKALTSLFETFVLERPKESPELARSLAKTLALSNASSEDILKTLLECLKVCLPLSQEILLEMIETVSVTGAEAGADWETLRNALLDNDALKETLSQRGREENPEILLNFGKILRRSLLLAGASLSDVAISLLSYLDSNENLTSEEKVNDLIYSLASGDVSPSEFALNIHSLLRNMGLSQESLTQKMMDALIVSGNGVQSVAEAVVELNLLFFLGPSTVETAKAFFKVLTSGQEIQKEEILSILTSSSSLKPESLPHIYLFSKALSQLDVSPELLGQTMNGLYRLSSQCSLPLDSSVGERVCEPLNLLEPLSQESFLRLLELERSLTLTQGLSHGALNNEGLKSLGSLLRLVSEESMSPLTLARWISFVKCLFDIGVSPQSLFDLLTPVFSDFISLRENDKESKPLNLNEVTNINRLLVDALQSQFLDSNLMSQIILSQAFIRSETLNFKSDSFLSSHSKGDKSLALSQLLSANDDSFETLRSLLNVLSATTFSLSSKHFSSLVQVLSACNENEDDFLCQIQKLMNQENVALSCGEKEENRIESMDKVMNLISGIKTFQSYQGLRQPLENFLKESLRDSANTEEKPGSLLFFFHWLSDVEPQELTESLKLLSSLESDFGSNGVSDVIKDHLQFLQDSRLSEYRVKDLFDKASQLLGLSSSETQEALMSQVALESLHLSSESLYSFLNFQRKSLASGKTLNDLADQYSVPEKEMKRIFEKEFSKCTLSNKAVSFLFDVFLPPDNLKKGDEIADIEPSLSSDDCLFNARLSTVNVESLGKVLLIQRFLLDSGVSTESLLSVLNGKLKEIVPRNDTETRLQPSLSLGIHAALRLRQILYAGTYSKTILSEINEKDRRLLESSLRKRRGDDDGRSDEEILQRLKDSCEPSLRTNLLIQELQITSALESSGLPSEEIEEMIQLLRSREDYQELLDSCTYALSTTGWNSSTRAEAVKQVFEKQINSLTSILRSIFLRCDEAPTGLPTSLFCLLQESMSQNEGSQNFKLALLDLVDDALTDVNDSTLDPQILLNYLNLAAVVQTVKAIEEQRLHLQDTDSLVSYTRLTLHNLLEQILNEAELNDDVKDIQSNHLQNDDSFQRLKCLLGSERCKKGLLRQVAFLYDLEEIENTTLLSLALTDIFKGAKHTLKAWELLKIRKIKGVKRCKVPKLAYSTVFCFYKVLPEHSEGPIIGLTYEE